MRILNLLLLCLLSVSVFAQEQLPEFDLSKNEMEAHLRFLSSDELQGRRTGEAGNNIAARYIAEQFRQYGLQPMPGQKDYFQKIPFDLSYPVKDGNLMWGETEYTHGQNMVVLSGGPTKVETKAVFAGFGLEDPEKGWDDYKGLKVKDKIVVVISGVPNSQNPMEVFQAMSTKRKLAAEKGAAGLIELYRLNFPWKFFVQFMGNERMSLANENEKDPAEDLFYAWVKEESKEASLALKNKKKARFKVSSSGISKKRIYSQNVIAWLPGTNPDMAEEHVVLSAHYDHVGTGKNGGSFYTPEDSIFNGARDNAMGTVALLGAAQSLSTEAASRPVVFIAFTGEEIGLLGSQYYVNNPLVPLNKTVFNFNADGPGYNDKDNVSILGYDRVGVKDIFDKSASQFGLSIIPDPAPEENLFDRSDNVSFAAKGVPAPTFSPGVTGFDEELKKYYHQVADNPDSIDFDYLLKYCKIFAYASRLIADKAERPLWKEGDKYEEISKELYKEEMK